jgi:hypothetical protein
MKLRMCGIVAASVPSLCFHGVHTKHSDSCTLTKVNEFV